MLKRLRPVPLIVGALVLIACIILIVHVRTREIPFDSRRWKENPKSTVRYRMHRDLVQRMRTERWNYARTVSELGAHGDPPYHMQYYLGTRWSGPWTLHVSFNRDGTLLEVEGTPQ
jgi:hypothetical protein